MHSITNVLIELDGESAVSESQVHATLIRRGAGPVQVDAARLAVSSIVSPRANTWRIDHRTVVLDWHKTEMWTESAPQVPTDGFARGARSPDYPSLRRGSLTSSKVRDMSLEDK